WRFRGLRICAAQLREPEHRAETRSGTGRGLLPPVDYRRRSHRSYLQTPRYTVIVNIAFEKLSPASRAGAPPLVCKGGSLTFGSSLHYYAGGLPAAAS